MKKAALTLGLIVKYVGSCGTILFVIFSVVYLLFGVSKNITGAVVFLVLSCPFALLFLLGRKLTSESDKTPQEPPMSAESIEPRQKEDFKNNTDNDIKISSSVIRKQEERTKKLREEQTLKYAQKITFENNNKEFVELMSKYISQTIEYISYYYNELNDHDVVIENFLLLAESKEVRFDISLHSGTRTAHIQRTKNALAEYINTKYVRVDLGAAENGTIGIIIPIPEYLAALFSNII